MLDKIIFYDIEVFKHYYLFKFLKDNKFITVSSKFDDEEEVRKNKLKILDLLADKSYILAGYNNYHYDDRMLEQFLKCKFKSGTAFMKKMNDSIIVHKSKFKCSYLFFNSIDLSQEIDSNMVSLKKIEGNMGVSIEESTLDFKTTRLLTNKEKSEIEFYCEYDVKMVKELFETEERQSYFQSKEFIINEFKPDADFWIEMRKQVTWLANDIFQLRKIKPKPSNFIDDLEVPDNIKKVWKNIYNYNLGIWKPQNDKTLPTDLKNIYIKMFTKGKNLNDKEKKRLIPDVIEFENIIRFGTGGLHGIHKTIDIVEADRFFNLDYIDVNSMYPSMIIAHEILGSATKLYEKVLKQRFEFKAQEDFVKSDAFKLLLNKVYGYLGFSNKCLENEVTFRCQTAIYNLAKQVEDTVEDVVQVNTDSVLVKYRKDVKDQLTNIISNWEEKYKLEMGFEPLEKIVQMNINGYIAIEDGKEEMKVKGKFFNPWKAGITKSCEFPIISKAISMYLMYGIPLRTTILEEENPRMFQYIAYATKKVKAVMDRTNNKELNHCNRVFIVKNGITISKLSETTNNFNKFGNLPDKKCLIFNKPAEEFDLSQLDYQFYLDLANEQLDNYYTKLYERSKTCIQKA